LFHKTRFAADSQASALDYLSRFNSKFNALHGSNMSDEDRQEYRLKSTRNSLTHFFLPHVGDDLDQKALYLGYMTNQLLSAVLGRRVYSDRDSFALKKVETPGTLVSFLFAQVRHRQFAALDCEAFVFQEMLLTASRTVCRWVQYWSKKLCKTFERELRKDLPIMDSLASIRLDRYIKSVMMVSIYRLYTFLPTRCWGGKKTNSFCGTTNMWAGHRHQVLLLDGRVGAQVDQGQQQGRRVAEPDAHQQQGCALVHAAGYHAHRQDRQRRATAHSNTVVFTYPSNKAHVAGGSSRRIHLSVPWCARAIPV
jgi:hypothetical protein